MASQHPALWSTPEGTWLLVLHICNGFFTSVPCSQLDVSGTALYRNDGTGWAFITEDLGSIGPFASGVTGLDAGAAVIWGGECPIEEVTVDGTRTCLSTEPEAGPVLDARAENGRLFALFRLGAALGEDPFEVRTFTRGSSFQTVGIIPETEFPNGLATDGENVLVWGGSQLVMTGTSQPGSLAAVPSVPAGDYDAGWLFGPDDFVLGNGIGQLLRFKGGTWSVLDLGVSAPVSALWGAPDGTLYFTASSAFGRVRGNDVEILVPRADETYAFSALWGNSASEVFLTLGTSELARYECGAAVALWFDGTAFHAL
jgi:hypothetical protein